MTRFCSEACQLAGVRLGAGDDAQRVWDARAPAATLQLEGQRERAKKSRLMSEPIPPLEDLPGDYRLESARRAGIIEPIV